MLSPESVGLLLGQAELSAGGVLFDIEAEMAGTAVDLVVANAELLGQIGKADHPGRLVAVCPDGAHLAVPPGYAVAVGHHDTRDSAIGHPAPGGRCHDAEFLGDSFGVPQRVVRVAGFDLPARVGQHAGHVVGSGEDRVGRPPVDNPGGRGEQAGDVAGDVLIEDGGNLGEGGDIGVVEGVHPTEDIVAGPVPHESAAHAVLDPSRPGQVGGEALAQ